jgi:glutamate N-acetyltransferase / amino-acid N-acetyltransferase
MNMPLLLLDEPTDVFSTVFTRDLFPGAPVVLGRKRAAGKLCLGPDVGLGLESSIAIPKKRRGVGGAVVSRNDIGYPVSV